MSSVHGCETDLHRRRLGDRALDRERLVARHMVWMHPAPVPCAAAPFILSLSFACYRLLEDTTLAPLSLHFPLPLCLSSLARSLARTPPEDTYTNIYTASPLQNCVQSHGPSKRAERGAGIRTEESMPAVDVLDVVLGLDPGPHSNLRQHTNHQPARPRTPKHCSNGAQTRCKKVPRALKTSNLRA